MNITDEGKRLIQSVINREVNEVKLPRLKPDEYISHINLLLGDEYDTNDYHSNFWVYWEDNTYCLSGDLWYDDNFIFNRKC